MIPARFSHVVTDQITHSVLPSHGMLKLNILNYHNPISMTGGTRAGIEPATFPCDWDALSIELPSYAARHTYWIHEC